MAPRKKVLSIAKTDMLRRTRQEHLNRAGYSVVSATDFNQIASLSKSETFDIALIGHAFSPEVKRCIADVIRRYFPVTPIVELTHARAAIQDSIPANPEPRKLKATIRGLLSKSRINLIGVTLLSAFSGTTVF